MNELISLRHFEIVIRSKLIKKITSLENQESRTEIKLAPLFFSPFIISACTKIPHCSPPSPSLPFPLPPYPYPSLFPGRRGTVRKKSRLEADELVQTGKRRFRPRRGRPVARTGNLRPTLHSCRRQSMPE